jgi:20S proteasome alpha/beta subunit
MTLIAALRCRDGVILGSDSQETRGGRGRRIARPAQKVYEPRSGFLLAWAGAQDAAQGFALRFARARGVSPNTDRLEVKRRLHEILAEVREDPSVEGRSDNVEFLIAWWSRRENKPVALHLFSGGASEWIAAWAFGGITLGVEGATFAVGAMRYINPGTLTLEQAKVVTLKVLRDTIEASVEGIGGRVQMATAQKSGLQVIEDTDMRGLHNTVDLWEAQCAELLPGSTAPPSASETPDRGVRPPG